MKESMLSMHETTDSETQASRDDVLVRVEGVSKKFCRNLKKSLWYGLKDLGGELLGRNGGRDELRPDEFWAVKDVSFELKRGECLGLIGRNGAGKTTLLRMLNGLIRPDQGRIEMRGRVGALIALGAGFNPILTGRENIYVNAAVLGLTRQEIHQSIEAIIDFAEIGDFIDSPVQSYSSGMQVRLGFAIASVLEPDILLLDEILAVGDSRFRVKCFNRIQELIKKCSVIFVSHAMPQITRICSHILLLHEGRPHMMSSDMGSVIERYHHINAIVFKPSIEGCGLFPIESVVIRDKSGIISSKLHHGDEFSIHITIDASHSHIHSKLQLLITFNNEEDFCVAQMLESVPQHDLCCRFIISLKFHSIPFNAGRYSLTASTLIGDKGDLAFVYRNAASFTVKHSYVGYAPIILNPNFKLLKVNDAQSSSTY